MENNIPIENLYCIILIIIIHNNPYKVDNLIKMLSLNFIDYIYL